MARSSGTPFPFSSCASPSDISLADNLLEMEFPMAENLLTIKEIAKRLDVPESNIRYYRDRFEDFLPSLGEGRKRRYKPEALEVFRFIVQGYKNDLNTEQITHRLITRFPRNLEPEDHQDTEPRHLPEPSSSRSPHALQDSLLHSQAKTLEHVTQALLQKYNLEKQFGELNTEQSRLRKGLLLVWKRVKQNQLTQGRGDSVRQTGTAVPSGWDELERRCGELEKRQHALEEKFEAHVVEVTALLDRCFNGVERLLELVETLDPDGQPGCSPEENG